MQLPSSGSMNKRSKKEQEIDRKQGAFILQRSAWSEI
jgi:hypothetical protein